MSSIGPTHQSPATLPLAVQIGFAGARRLVPDELDLHDEDRTAFEQEVAAQLSHALIDLPRRLRLGDEHFLVGISQMAAGADLLFSQTITDLGWGQRVFLPQARDEYLAAQGSAGNDFSPEQAARARELLDGPQVIEEAVMTRAKSRPDRFHETNVAILDEADALVCLRVARRDGKVGGTAAMVKRARELDKAVLELVLQLGPDGRPVLDPQFHPALDRQGRERSVAPTIPSTAPSVSPRLELARQLTPASWPGHISYADALKRAASAGAALRQNRFRMAAGVVVGTHVVATLLALLAMTVVTYGPGWSMIAVLGLEVALLSWGYLTHRFLHHGRQPEHWAMARLCAEVCRSVLAYGMLPGSLRYLLILPMPAALKPLMRTMVVLHLRDVHGQSDQAWRTEFARYLDVRLLRPGTGQIAYYDKKQREAKRYASVAGRAFTAMSMLAIVATATKLSLKLSGIHVDPWFGGALAILAVLLPVVAVGALSFTAALDIEARIHTFEQMHDFVERQGRYLLGVDSAGEAAACATDTEIRLLSETVTWYARRAYTSVA